VFVALHELIHITSPPRRGDKYCDERVCVSTRSHISKPRCIKFAKFFIHIDRNGISVFTLAALRYAMYVL